MGLNLKQVHVYREVSFPNGEKQQRLVETHPALRLRGEQAQFAIWIQDGELYGDGGARINVPPPWFHDEVQKCDPQALAAVGYHTPARSVTVAPATGHEVRACKLCRVSVVKKHWARHVTSKGHARRAGTHAAAARQHPTDDNEVSYGDDHTNDTEPA